MTMTCFRSVFYLGATANTSRDSTAKLSSRSSRNDDAAAGKPMMSLDNDVTPTSTTHISLDTLFKGASRHCDNSEANLFRFALYAGTHRRKLLRIMYFGQYQDVRTTLVTRCIFLRVV